MYRLLKTGFLFSLFLFLAHSSVFAQRGSELDQIRQLKAQGDQVPQQLIDKVEPNQPLVILPGSSTRQGGSDCASAVAIGSLPYTDSGVIDATTTESWYLYQAPDSQTITVSLCGSDFDTKLTVYTTGSCGAFTDTLYNDDSCGVQSELAGIGLDSLQTIYIKVWPYGSATGNYALDVHLQDFVPYITLVSSPVDHVVSAEADSVVVTATDTQARSITETTLFYRYTEADTWSSVLMTATGNPDEYVGLIPPSGHAPVYPAQDTTFYYIQSVDDDLNTTLLPSSGYYSYNILPEPPTAGGPDETGYTWVNSDDAGGPAYGWTELLNPQTITGLSDDNYVGPFSIGFSFPFYFATYDSFYVGSNGIIGFTPDYMSSLSNQTLPNTYTPNNLIAWFWDDLNINDGGTVVYGMDGSNLVVTYTDYHEYSGGGSVTAQVIFTPAGDIRINYQSFLNNIDLNGCTVGIENADGTDGLSCRYNTNGMALHDALSLMVTRPVGDIIPPVIVHTPLEDTPDTMNPYTVSAEITDESGIASATISWFTTGDTTDVAMSHISGDTWEGDIPAQPAMTTIFYYITAVDAGANAKTTVTETWSFYIGDQTPPEIAHTPLGNQGSTTTPYPVSADITDDSGIATATLTWIVDSDTTDVAMVVTRDTYTADIPAQAGETTVSYFITAVDGAAEANAATTGVYTFDVFDYQWAPRYLVASDSLLGETRLTWNEPTPPLPENTYQEGFEAGIPVDWTVLNQDGDNYTWTQQAYWMAHEGDYVAGCYSSYDPNNDWLITRSFTATDTTVLSYYLLNASEFETVSCTVLLSTSGADPVNFTDTLLSVDLGTDGIWHYYEHDLSAYSGSDFQIAFVNNSDYGYLLTLDDVQLSGVPGEFTTTRHIPDPNAHMLTWRNLPTHPRVTSEKQGEELLAAYQGEHPEFRTEWEREFTQYNVYRDGVLIGNASGTSFTDGPDYGADPNVVYTYYVTALWDEGESNPSNTDTGYYYPRPTSGGPDATGYTWMNSFATDPEAPTYTWITPVHEDTITTLTDDNVVGPFPVGFNFDFYVSSFDSFYVGSNGLMGFDPTGMNSLSNTRLPSSGTPNEIIAWFWDDLDYVVNTGIPEATVTYGNDIAGNLVVSFFDYPEYGAYADTSLTRRVTAQVILFTDGDIQVNYQSFGESLDLSGGTVGIENAAGTDGLEVRYNDEGTRFADEMALQFFRPLGDIINPVIVHTPLGDTEDEINPYTVSAEITDESGIAGATLYWFTGVDTTAVAMSNASGDIWVADIPAQTAPATVDYFINAVDAGINSNETTTETYRFNVVSYTWPPQNLVASESSSNPIVLTWQPPTAPPQPGEYFEGFEEGLPADWLVFNYDNGDAWTQYAGGHESDYCAAVTYDLPNNDWLITHELVATDETTLSFWLANGSSSWMPEHFKLGISTTGTDSTSFTMIMDMDLPEDIDWHQYTTSLAAYTNPGDTFRMAFVCTSYNMLRLKLDDVFFQHLGGTEMADAGHIPNPQADLLIPENLPIKFADSMTESQRKQLMERFLVEHPDFSLFPRERDFITYNIYRDGVFLASTTSLMFNDGPDNLAYPGVTYDYYVTAQWDLGESDPSNHDTGSYTALGYQYHTSDDPEGCDYDWVTLTTPTVITGLADDNVVGPFPIGFTFNYYGNDYTEFYFNSNGTINFDGSYITYNNVSIPSISDPNNFIAWFWDDLNPSSGGTAEYGLEGGNLVITVTDYHEYANSGTLTAQVVLTPAGEIIMNYQSFDNGIDIAGCTIGIENSDGTSGLMPLFNGSGVALHNEFAICYGPATIEEPTAPVLEITREGGHILLTVVDEYGWDEYDLYESTEPFNSYTQITTLYPADPTYTESFSAAPRFYYVIGRTGVLTSTPPDVKMNTSRTRK